MLVILTLCLLQLLHDVDGCETSKNGYTWTFQESIDEVVPGVETFKDCQDECLQKESCTAYTLVEGPLNYCFLFPDPSELISCSECKSGFATRIITGSGCAVDLDDIIEETVANSVEECLDLCVNTIKCTNFLYFNSSSILRNVCYLYKGCNGTGECEDCQSGELHCFPPTDGCSNYKVLDDSTRHNQWGYEHYCDYYGTPYTSPDWQGPGWYRLAAPAGTMIPEEDPDYYHCGTSASGWTTDTHPIEAGQQKNMTVCFSYSGHECFVQTEITATNCGQFYVYNLQDTPCCNCRYCGSF